MIKLMRIYHQTLKIFSPFQETNTHTIQGVQRIILLLKHQNTIKSHDTFF